MEQLEEQDIVRIKELLRRTGEFIAYFELAESKMIEWRHDIEQRAIAHDSQFDKQLHALQLELGSLQEMFTMAGLAKLRLVAENALKQGEQYLSVARQAGNNILEELAHQKEELRALGEQTLVKLEEHTAKSIKSIDAQLGKYNAQQFARTAMDSCEQVEKTAKNAISISNKLFKMFQWRTIALSVITTILTAFAIGLYMSDEFPWEIHEHAMNERDAGKLLMNAWPKLSYQEKVKILGEKGTNKV